MIYYCKLNYILKSILLKVIEPIKIKVLVFYQKLKIIKFTINFKLFTSFKIVLGNNDFNVMISCERYKQFSLIKRAYYIKKS